MEYIQIRERPQLRQPAVIAAFAGWNDAAESATSAARYLISALSARKFAEIDPEEFHVFTETRPRVRVVGGLYRQIDWPATAFFYASDSHLERDLIILVGTEPQLHWKTFTKVVIDLMKEHNTSLVVTLGGLLADVAHSSPVRLNGSASDPALQERIRHLDVHSTRYEGPTGIVGVLNNACRQAGLPALSLWGNVPHYLAASPNPKVQAALVIQVNALLNLALDLSDLEAKSAQFDAQVSAAIKANPEISAYVKQLEERQGGSGEGEPQEPAPDQPSELPSAEVVVRELEEFLKRSQQSGNDEPPDNQ